MDQNDKPQHWFVALTVTAFLSFVVAVIAAIIPMLLGFAAICGIVPTLRSAFLDARRSNRTSFGIATTLVASCVFVATLYAAHLAPFKTPDEYLERVIELPRKSITLRELACLDDDYSASLYLKGVTVFVAEDSRHDSVDFPATTLTLREFVAAIESQTPLRHQFGHCGNGSTVFWGGDCSFGLHLAPPVATNRRE